MLPQKSRGCVHALAGARECVPSTATMTATVPGRRSAAPVDVDTSALHLSQVWQTGGSLCCNTVVGRSGENRRKKFMDMLKKNASVSTENLQMNSYETCQNC